MLQGSSLLKNKDEDVPDKKQKFMIFLTDEIKKRLRPLITWENLKIAVWLMFSFLLICLILGMNNAEGKIHCTTFKVL